MIQLTETTFISSADDVMAAHVISYVNSNKIEERTLIIKLKEGYTFHVEGDFVDSALKKLSNMSSSVTEQINNTPSNIKKVPTTIQPWLSAAQELSLGKRRW